MYNKDRHKDTNHKLTATGCQQQQQQEPLEAVHDLLLSADSSKTTIYDIEVKQTDKKSILKRSTRNSKNLGILTGA